MNFRISAFAIALLLAADPGFSQSVGTAKQIFDSAVQAMQAGNYTQAEDGFHKVLQLDPRNVSALANLGILFAKTHRYTEAIEEYKSNTSNQVQ